MVGLQESGKMHPRESKSLMRVACERDTTAPKRSKSECAVRTQKTSLVTDIPEDRTIKRPNRRRPYTGTCRRVRQKRSRGRIVRVNGRNVEYEETLDDVFSRLRMSTSEDILRPAKRLGRNTQHRRQDIIVEQHRHRQQRRDSVLAKGRFQSQLNEDEANQECLADSIDSLTELFGKLKVTDEFGEPKRETNSRKRKLPHIYYTDEGPTEPKRLCDRVYVDLVVFQVVLFILLYLKFIED